MPVLEIDDRGAVVENGLELLLAAEHDLVRAAQSGGEVPEQGPEDVERSRARQEAEDAGSLLVEHVHDAEECKRERGGDDAAERAEPDRDQGDREHVKDGRRLGGVVDEGAEGEDRHEQRPGNRERHDALPLRRSPRQSRQQSLGPSGGP